MRALTRTDLSTCFGSLCFGLSSVALLAGCAGSGAGLDQNGAPPTSGSVSTALTADFESIQDNVFTPICTRCHEGAGAPFGLRLDAANSYTLLVGVASGESPNLKRVQPGNPGASYLLQKLSGTAAVGERMPLGGPFLPQETIDVISQWITNGAPRPVSIAGLQKTSTSEMGLQVTTSSPLDGELVSAALSQIVIGFNRDIDPNLVNASTVSLESLDSKVNVATRLNVPLVNPATLLVTPTAPLTPGAYRLTLRGSGGGALAGLDAVVLNASTNGEGTDFSITFTVTSTEVRP
jgi:methionine-rich copper-binding protein CopC